KVEPPSKARPTSLRAGLGSCRRQRTPAVLQRRSVASASLDDEAATVRCSEGPVPCRRLGAMLRATRLLVAHEAEAAARDQRERLRGGSGFAHQLQRASNTAPGAYGHESPPGIGSGRDRNESAS